jgi:hypothetical protein
MRLACSMYSMGIKESTGSSRQAHKEKGPCTMCDWNLLYGGKFVVPYVAVLTAALPRSYRTVGRSKVRTVSLMSLALVG